MAKTAGKKRSASTDRQRTVYMSGSNGLKRAAEPKKTAGSRRRKAKKNKAGRLLCIVLGILVIVTVSVLYIAGRTVYRQRGAYPGVKAEGIDAAGMTEAEIAEVLRKEADAWLTSDVVTVEVDEVAVTVNAKDAGLDYTVTETAAEAAAYCRSGKFFERFREVMLCRRDGRNFTMEMTVDPDAVLAIAQKIAEEVSVDYAASSWYRSGMTVFADKGQTGRTLDAQALAALMEQKFTARESCVIRMSATVREPDAIDLDAVAAASETEPQDAYIDSSDASHFTVVEEKSGSALDRGKAEAILAGNGIDGRHYEIPLETVEAAVTKASIEAMFYRDVLAEVTTELNAGNVNRTKNVRLACEKCNGTVIGPGDVFSYNTVVGPRTYDRGFVDAIIFQAGEQVDGVGGGICQVSSTIYMAALRADLKIVSRANHSFAVTYTPKGEDATVVYGYTDFQFKNNTGYPVRLEVSLSGSTVRVRIVGTQTTPGKSVKIETNVIGTVNHQTVEQEDASLAPGTRVLKQSGFDGYICESYRVVYVNGEEVSRSFESKSVYKAQDTVYLVGPAE